MEDKMIQDSELEKVSEQTKKAYQSPTLTEWGTVNDLTQGGSRFATYDDGDDPLKISSPI